VSLLGGNVRVREGVPKNTTGIYPARLEKVSPRD